MLGSSTPAGRARQFHRWWHGRLPLYTHSTAVSAIRAVPPRRRTRPSRPTNRRNENPPAWPGVLSPKPAGESNKGPRFRPSLFVAQPQPRNLLLRLRTHREPTRRMSETPLATVQSIVRGHNDQFHSLRARRSTVNLPDGLTPFDQ